MPEVTDPAAEPTPGPSLSGKQKAGAAIAAAVLIAAPLATQFEGYRSKAYFDPTHILTVCYGETAGVDPSRIYSKSECASQLRARMARDYAPALLKCLPALGDMRRRYVFGALLDASYNAGTAAVCRSRMAASIRAGDWSGACSGFVGWYVTGTDRRTGQHVALKGLVVRRQAEAKTCATPVARPSEPPPTATAVPAPLAPAATPQPTPQPTLWQRLARFFGHIFGNA